MILYFIIKFYGEILRLMFYRKVKIILVFQLNQLRESYNDLRLIYNYYKNKVF